MLQVSRRAIGTRLETGVMALEDSRRIGAFAIVLAGAALAAVAVGCGGGGDDEDEASTDGAPTAVIEYPEELSSASTPTEVAEVLIRALDEGDNETLGGLVASKAEAEAINKIFAKHGRRGNTRPESAAALALSGWRASYATFRKGETEVEREVVDGDTATVFTRGMLRVGKSQGLKIRMLREGPPEGAWKVRAGLQALAVGD
jgi:hypothetical protein